MARGNVQRSFMDKLINVIALLILAYFIIGEFSHLYRTVSPMKSAKNLYESHYVLSSTFPFVGRYLLMTPKGYDPKYKYPLVVALHGVGTNVYAADQLAKKPYRNKYPFFVMVPIAPTRAFWATPEDKEYRMKRNIPYPDHLPFVVAGINQIAKTYEIDRKKVIITGHSMGGSGVIGALERYPNIFKFGVASAGAWSPKEISNVKAPFLLFHGSRDMRVPVKNSIELERAAKQQGKSAMIHVMQRRGHGIGDSVYSNPAVWDMALEAVK